MRPYFSICIISVYFMPTCSKLKSLFRTKIHTTFSTSLDKPANTVEPGHVYFVATPLGNLFDMSNRGIDVLNSVDVICAEDTRHTIKLLRHFKIPNKPLISHHEHNWSEQIPKIISMALSGKSIAVVSDAGTPGASNISSLYFMKF